MITTYNEAFTDTIENIKARNTPLYQSIHSKDFSSVFAGEFFKLSGVLEQKGLKDFKVRTTNGFTTIQPFNIASTLTFLKIHNEHLNADEFLTELFIPRDGYFEFGYLLSTQIESRLVISNEVEIHPYSAIVDKLSAINKNEIEKFLDNSSPELHINKNNLATLLIRIPLDNMVFEEDRVSEGLSSDKTPIPSLLAHEKLKEIRELISLISEGSIVILSSWGSYSDQRLDYFLGLRPNINRDYYSESGFSIFYRSCMTTTDWGKYNHIYDFILKSKSSTELKVALDRVYVSMANPDFMGKVLDISIAMEVMCVSGRGDNTYKVSNHMAWLCSDDYSERILIMKTIKDFYSLRSSIVHEGKLSTSTTKSYGGEVSLYNAVLLHVRTALVKLLEHGCKPDWNQVAANGGLLKPHATLL